MSEKIKRYGTHMNGAGCWIDEKEDGEYLRRSDIDIGALGMAVGLLKEEVGKLKKLPWITNAVDIYLEKPTKAIAHLTALVEALK